MSGSSYSSLADIVAHYESSGNPQATTGIPGATASGLYGFTNPTWASYAPGAGVDLSQYPTAASAPSDVQTSVFNQAVSQNGLNDWTCNGCDPALTSYLQSNPSALSLPVTNGGSGVPGSTAATGTAATPAASGTASGTGSLLNPLNWFSALGSWVGGIAARASLFVLAIIFILIALVLFGLKSGISVEGNPAGSE